MRQIREATKGAKPTLWAVVLAAGQGSRMTQVTHLLCGQPLPKQFVPLVSERTMLQETLDRMSPLIPSCRTVVVVAEGHEELAHAQLADRPGVEIVVQPRDLGTGPGLLLPLAHVLARDPDATVAVFPSDHHFERAEPLRAALALAVLAAEEASSGVALLGAHAEHPASDLGWIVPLGQTGASKAGLVGRFVEKPPERMARALMAAGGLWNTMLMVGAAQAFWRLCRVHLPSQTQSFGLYLDRVQRPEGAACRDLLYRTIPAADFSRAVLEKAAGLAVVPLVNSGWFDCGTPERFIQWLRKTADRHGILPRLAPMAAQLPGDEQVAVA
jgi:mannose-1-phosphate guanylyltransferase